MVTVLMEKGRINDEVATDYCNPIAACDCTLTGNWNEEDRQ